MIPFSPFLFTLRGPRVCPVFYSPVTSLPPLNLNLIYSFNVIKMYLRNNILRICYIIVDGGWGAWADWATCSVTCGGGQRNRTRICDNPLPAHGGSECTDNGSSNFETEGCNNNNCPSKLKSVNIIKMYISSNIL